MESQVVRRRANVIAAHLASHEDISATATHVFPMTCSNSLNSVIGRCDNRMYFARQCSGSLGCHMRPASNEQGNFKSNGCQDKRTNALEPPVFSRPALSDRGIPNVKGIQSVDPSPEAPMFARPNETRGPTQFHFTERTHNVSPKGKWSPRMDVVESGFNYFITLEIPGVSIDNIKVEVNDQSLIVSGNRSNLSCGAIGSNKTTSCYHRREIFQGPYQIVWPLPTNANKENVSAEIQDGLLRITIPKLSGLRWLRKAHI
ncbi:Molecular chaperone (small heat-shock protein Hsp26/Hsp42) [Handroanthus impetiginosus]|uniref:Molecular chaperone (Small heat-shock protein Hsp26/Hsp42) n=1 Tax=Handroanthus impetiginosus TaxID=429701 RepID=A0A2G9GL32_9LAMI|nr:Molecular chaperone (small heat-shock protein Hsp26/Hsp42) [Handroanthus impetiginosus]